jgi:ribosomal-protein-alanine N-acetyltransferase
MPAFGPQPVLETARLRLRPYEAGDIEPMAAMFGDPEVRAFTYLGTLDRAQTGKVLDEYVGYLAEHGYGMLAILDRETGAYCGEVGLFTSPMGPLALRYALNRGAWGRGLATEASAAVIDDTFGRLGLEKLFAGVKDVNVASVGVVRKLGFVYESEATAHGHTFGVYGLTARDWRSRRG